MLRVLPIKIAPLAVPLLHPSWAGRWSPTLLSLNSFCARCCCEAAMDTTQGLTRRLSFGEVLLPRTDEHGVLAALHSPTVEGLRGAAELVHASSQARLDAVEGIAREQCDAVGEADLRRLKRQFSSLKNTFLHYEVKQSFITGLAEGLPSGGEEAELQQVEQEVETNAGQLRQLKNQNEQVQRAISDLVDRIADTRDSLDRTRQGIATDLGRLQQDLAQHAELMAQPLPELPEGLEEEELRAALAAAAAETREDEYKIAAELAVELELEAAAAYEQTELAALNARLAELEAQAAAQGEKVETDTRLRQALDRCDTVMGMLSMLSGMAVLQYSPDFLQLRLTTFYPTTEGAPPTSAQHVLALQLQPGTRQVERAVLEPADVEVVDVVEGAPEERRRLDCLVQEVQSRLSTWLQASQA